jgi:aconitate hydratase
MLPLTFADPNDYDKINSEDRITLEISGDKFQEGKPVTLIAKSKEGKKTEIKLEHTFNEQHIRWFKAGSALNLIAQAQKTKV